jgi:hypothetical protein
MAEGAKGEKFRLRDMIVESVDLVDRPANKKRFLLFKREEDMDPNAQAEGLTTAPPEEEGASVQVPEADVESGAEPTAKGEGDTEPQAAAGDTGDAGTDASAQADAQAGEGEGEQAVEKMAEAHAKLLAEKMGAIQKVAKEIADGAAGMEPKDLRAKLSQLESMGWKVGDVAEVVNVHKSEDGEPATTEKAEMPQGVKDAVKKVLREAVERLMSVNNALRVATVTQDKMSAPLPDPVFREVRSILTMVKNVLQQYPAPKAAGEPGEGEAEDATKAEGDTEPQATAKADGEKAPEPQAVGNETALELLKATASLTLPAPVRDAVAEQVRGATEVFMSAMAEVDKAPTTEGETDTPMPAAISDAIDKGAAALEEMLQKYPAPSAKSEGVLAELHTHFNAIENIVKQIVGGEPVVVKAEAQAGEENAAPNAELLKRLDAIAADVKKNADTIAQVAGTPNPSNALEDDGGTAGGGEGAEPSKVEKGSVDWGNDLAAEIEPEPADAE